MKCPSKKQMVRLQDGELSVNQTQVLRQHILHCSQCSRLSGELQQLSDKIRIDPAEFSDPKLQQAILTQLSVVAPKPGQSRRKFSSRWAPVSLALATGAVAFVLIFLLLPTEKQSFMDPGDQFQARAAFTDPSQRWWALWMFESNESARQYREVKSQISQDAQLVFGYLNHPPVSEQAYSHLMIFGIDQQAHVFWYYPAFQELGTDPKSISIQPGKHPLPDRVEHSLHTGRLCIFALFTKSALRVSQMEQMVRQQISFFEKPMDPEKFSLPHEFQEALLLPRCLVVEPRNKP